MKTAVRRILVLAQALFAHCETGHGGQRPVVGNLPRDRIARAAVGAVSEWITMPAIPIAAKIPQAVIAGGDVRRNRRQPSWLIHASANDKTGITRRRQSLDRYIFDLRQRRSLIPQASNKPFHPPVGPFHFDGHTRR